MQLRYPKKTGITTKKTAKGASAARGLVLLFFLCVIIKLAVTAANGALSAELAARLSSESAVEALLDFELGSAGNGVFAVFNEMLTYPDSGIEDETELSEPVDNHAIPVIPSGRDRNENTLFYTEPPPEETDEITEPTPVLPGENAGGSDILLDNTTDYIVDIEALLNKSPEIKLKTGEPAVLLISTHTSEAYTQSGYDKYTQSDPFRTEDTSQNIVRVAKELASELEKRGITVVHDTRSYDYPSYTGAYNRTYTSVQNYLQKYPTIKIVIDLHRDSIAAADGSQYKTLAQIGDESCSQVMFVVGSEAAGLKHPTWRDNLTLALHIQREMNALYPSLARPVRISQYRYNQQLTPGALLVEVGCAGNTLQESLTAVRYFADAASNVLLSFYE